MSDKSKIKPRYSFLGIDILDSGDIRAVIVDTYKVNLEFLAGKFNKESMDIGNFIRAGVIEGKNFKGVEALSLEELKDRVKKLEGKDNITELQEAINQVEPLVETMKLGSEVEFVETAPSAYKVKTVTRKNIPKAPPPRG